MTSLFKILLWLLFTDCVTSGRIVGNISGGKNIKQSPTQLQTESRTDSQCIITNKNNIIYYEKDKELFLEDNNFIKNKKLISISPGGLKGFYELGVLSYIKDNYDMDGYIFSGASAGAWNALFMCFKNDTKQFVYNLLDYKLSQIKTIKELEYFLKYKILSRYDTNDFDLRRLFIGVTTLKQFKPVTNIFSDFNSLEDAINCCIASSHIPLITGGLTNRYHNMYTFDGGFSKYPYLNFSENVLHITPSMWKKLNNNVNVNVNVNLNDKTINKKQAFLNSFTSLNVILELFLMIKNKNYMELFDNGYLDAKTNKELLDKIFLETVKVEPIVQVEKNDTSNNYHKLTHEYDSDNDNNYKIDFYTKDNDSY
jgi:hypothetical protein